MQTTSYFSSFRTLVSAEAESRRSLHFVLPDAATAIMRADASGLGHRSEELLGVRSENLITLWNALPVDQTITALPRAILLVAAAKLLADVPARTSPKMPFHDLTPAQWSVLSNQEVWRIGQEELIEAIAFLRASYHKTLSEPLLEWPEEWKLALQDPGWVGCLLNQMHEGIEELQQRDPSLEGPVLMIEIRACLKQRLLHQGIVKLMELYSLDESVRRGVCYQDCWMDIAELCVQSTEPDKALPWLILSHPEEPLHNIAISHANGRFETRYLPVERRDTPENVCLLKHDSAEDGPQKMRWNCIVRQMFDEIGSKLDSHPELVAQVIQTVKYLALGAVQADVYAAVAELPQKSLLILERTIEQQFLGSTLEESDLQILDGVRACVHNRVEKEWAAVINQSRHLQDPALKVIIQKTAEVAIDGMHEPNRVFTNMEDGSQLRGLLGLKAGHEEEYRCSITWPTETIRSACEDSLLAWLSTKATSHVAKGIIPAQRALTVLRSEMIKALEESGNMALLKQELFLNSQRLQTVQLESESFLAAAAAPILAGVGMVATRLLDVERELRSWQAQVRRINRQTDASLSRQQECELFEKLRYYMGEAVYRALQIKALDPTGALENSLNTLISGLKSWGAGLRNLRAKNIASVGYAGYIRGLADDTGEIYRLYRSLLLKLTLKHQTPLHAMQLLGQTSSRDPAAEPGETILGIDSPTELLDLWRLIVRGAVNKQYYMTAQTMLARAMRQYTIWSLSAQEFCSREIGSVQQNRRGQPVNEWRRLPTEGLRETIVSEWSHCLKNYFLLNGKKHAYKNIADIGVIGMLLEVLRKNSDLDLRKMIYSRCRRELFTTSAFEALINGLKAWKFERVANELKDMSVEFDCYPQQRVAQRNSELTPQMEQGEALMRTGFTNAISADQIDGMHATLQALQSKGIAEARERGLASGSQARLGE